MDTSLLILVLIGLASLVIGFIVGSVLGKRAARSAVQNAKTLSDTIIKDAQKTTENFRKETEIESKDALLKMKLDFEVKTRETRESLKEQELTLISKDSNLARKVDLMEKKETSLKDISESLERKQAKLDQKLTQVNRLIGEQNVRLERIAGMSAADAKDLLMTNLESETKLEAARRLKDIREETDRTAQRESQKIITLAIQRYAAEQCVETTVSVVDLPTDEMKGRIIGKEGRNIRAFEKATGVDVVIDDTPEAVTLSSFDPVRREVARLSLQRLVQALETINAMSLIHEALYQSEDLAHIDFGAYLAKLCRNLGQTHGTSHKRIAVTVEPDGVSLGMDQGIAVGMVICELVSNAFKHAFPERQEGSVSIRLSGLDEEEMELIVQDDGIGLPPEIDILNSPSIGLQLAVAAVTRELGGSIEVERDGGTRFVIRLQRKNA